MATQRNRYSQAEEDAIGRALSSGGFGNTAGGFTGGQVDTTTGNLRPGSEVDVSKGTKPEEVIPKEEEQPKPTTPAPITPVTPITPPPAPAPAPEPAPVDPLSRLPTAQAMMIGRNQYQTYQGAWKRGGANGLYFVPQGMDDARGQQLTAGTFGNMNVGSFFGKLGYQGLEEGGIVPPLGGNPRYKF